MSVFVVLHHLMPSFQFAIGQEIKEIPHEWRLGDTSNGTVRAQSQLSMPTMWAAVVEEGHDGCAPERCNELVLRRAVGYELRTAHVRCGEELVGIYLGLKAFPCRGE